MDNINNQNVNSSVNNTNQNNIPQLNVTSNDFIQTTIFILFLP